MVRLKNRYILCRVISQTPNPQGDMPSKRELQRAIEKTARELFGDYGLGCISLRLRVLKLHPYTRTVIIRVQRNAGKMLAQTLPFIKQCNDKRITIQTLHISGTISACEKYLIRHERRCLIDMVKESRNKEERRKLQEAIISCTFNPDGDGEDGT